MRRRLLIPIACFALLLAACGDDTRTVADLTVIQQVRVEFGEMERDVAEETLPGSIVEDLRAEADYVRLAPSLRCAELDAADSLVEIRRLEAPGLETPLNLLVEIAPSGGVSWRDLAEFNGVVADDELIFFDAPGFVVFTEGADLLSALALSDEPIYELRLTAEVPDDIDDLTLDLELALDMSNLRRGCPH